MYKITIELEENTKGFPDVVRINVVRINGWTYLSSVVKERVIKCLK